MRNGNDIVKGIAVKMKKNNKIAIIILGVFIGVALIIIGGGEEKNKVPEATDEKMEKYSEAIEGKILDLCLKVEGVSNVSVAVSFKNGFEYVYAQNDEKGEILVIGNGSAEKVVAVTQKNPIIAGIGIVCSGGGDPCIQEELINLISAAFGISSNKIYVVEAKNNVSQS